MKKFVDSNVFLRFLLADHPRQSPACRRLFEKASKKEIILVTLPIVIIEISWVLQSFYKRSKKEIAEKLKIILLFEGLEIDDREILLTALEIFENKNIDFIDAYISSWLKLKKIKQIYSYDQDYDKIEEIRRLEPK